MNIYYGVKYGEAYAAIVSCYSALRNDGKVDGGYKLLEACNVLEDGSLTKKLYVKTGNSTSV